MQHRILFLAANPGETDRRELDREAHAIQAELERSGCRGCFAFETRWAAEPLDLLRELRRLKPTVVHFSGRGGRTAGGVAPSDGLLFHGPDHRPQVVSTAAITETFGAAGGSVRLVVLEACYTELQAQALLAHVDCVVGMAGAVHDAAARSFAIGFYGGLGEREPVAAAFRQGRAAIQLEGLPETARPRLLLRAGVDANRLVLAAPEDAPAASGSSPPRQFTAVNHAERDVVIRSQVVHLVPDATEQEREARGRRLERQRQADQDRLYLDDPMMKHRHSEAVFVKAAGSAVAVVGAIAVALGQIPLGIAVLTGAGLAMYYLITRSRRSR